MAGEPSLEFYWFETKKGEEVGDRWGQLSAGRWRLLTVREDLAALGRTRDAQRGLRRLESSLEIFFYRVFEVRERLLTLLAAKGVLSQRDVARLRRADQREEPLSRIRQAHPELARVVGEFFTLLKNDFELRNRHTHNDFLSLGIWTGNDIFDPYDALVDYTRDAPRRAELERWLRRQVKKKAGEYIGKLERLDRVLEELLRITEPAFSLKPSSCPVPTKE